MLDETSLMGSDAQEETTSIQDSNNQGHIAPTDQDPKVFQRPDDIGEDLWDTETNTFKSDAIYKALKAEKDKVLGLRKTISKGLPKPAEKIEDYSIANASELGIKEDDEKLNVLKGIALETGLSNDQFQKMLNAFNKAGKDGHFNDFEDEDPEVAQIQREEAEKERVKAEMQKLGKDAPKIVNNLKAWGRKLMSDGVYSKEDYDAYMQLGTDSTQIRALHKLMQVAGYIDDFAVTGTSSNGSKSLAEIETMMKDPRYLTDEGYRNQITEWFQNNT